MKYQVQENCLTIFLPKELDHHNAEKIRRKSDRLIEKHHIKCVIFEVWAVHANERMKKILTMSGVTKIIQIYEEEEA